MDLFLLILSVIVAMLAGRTAAAIKSGHTAIRTAPGGPRLRGLDHYDLAYLAGGPHRVANTALALLAEAGVIRVSRGGRVHHVSAGAGSRNPVDDVALSVVADRSGLPVIALRREIARSLAVDAIKQHLTGRGLILPDDAFTTVNRLSRRLRGLSVVAFAGVLLEGVVLIAGPGVLPWSLLAGAAVLPWAGLLVFAGTGVGAEVAIAGHRRSRRTTVTTAGRETLDAAMQANVQGVAAGAVPVALYGLGEVRDTSLRAELGGGEARRLRLHKSSYAWYGSAAGMSSHGEPGCGSGASCGGGSGCGGGGGGGGGCGGGGGG